MRSLLQTSVAKVLGTALIAASLLTAQAFAAGYEPIDPPQNTSTADKVEVLEFFWSGCPHCYQFEPTIETWKESKPDHVAFVREAPPLNPSWEQHARAFYAARQLGKEDEWVDAMFTAIHEERQHMRKPGDLGDLAAELGMDKDTFIKAMKSFAVDTHMRRAMQLAKGAGITGVPAIVINGKYRTSASLAGGNNGIIDTINELVEVEREAMGLPLADQASGADDSSASDAAASGN